MMTAHIDRVQTGRAVQDMRSARTGEILSREMHQASSAGFRAVFPNCSPPPPNNRLQPDHSPWQRSVLT